MLNIKKSSSLFSLIQARSQALREQLGNVHDQLEQSVVELNTFRQLQSLERSAMPDRLEVSGSFYELNRATLSFHHVDC